MQSENTKKREENVVVARRYVCEREYGKSVGFGSSEIKIPVHCAAAAAVHHRRTATMFPIAGLSADSEHDLPNLQEETHTICQQEPHGKVRTPARRWKERARNKKTHVFGNDGAVSADRAAAAAGGRDQKGNSAEQARRRRGRAEKGSEFAGAGRGFVGVVASRGGQVGRAKARGGTGLRFWVGVTCHAKHGFVLGQAWVP